MCILSFWLFFFLFFPPQHIPDSVRDNSFTDFRGGGKESGQKSWRGLIQTYVELSLSHYASAVWGHQRRLSDQSRGERTRPVSATPRGETERSSCFMFISPRLTCPVFFLLFFSRVRLIERLTGSFEAFLRGDEDPVVCEYRLGAKRHGTASCPFRPIPDCHAGNNRTFLCGPFFHPGQISHSASDCF